MKNDVNIKNVANGVNINIKGNIKFSDVEQMTQSCANGECDCSAEAFKKIKEIKTLGKDGNVTISLKSDDLSAKEVQEMMNGCDCGF